VLGLAVVEQLLKNRSGRFEIVERAEQVLQTGEPATR